MVARTRLDVTLYEHRRCCLTIIPAITVELINCAYVQRRYFICPPSFSYLPDRVSCSAVIISDKIWRVPVTKWAGRSGIESRWGPDFPPVQTGPSVHPASCTMGTGSFSGVKCGRRVLLTTQPLLVPRSWKSRAIPLPTLWATPDL